MNPRNAYLLMAATATLAALGLASCTQAPEPVVQAPAASPATGNVSDVDVTEHVQTALRQSEMLKTFEIGVFTLKGDVRLNGVLDNQAQIDETLRIARAAEGMHSIHDELTIRK